MAEYKFPNNGDLDNANLLLGLLGTYWANTYAGNDIIKSYTSARAQVEAQSHLNLLEVVATLSKRDIPVFHKEMWQILFLKESELNEKNPNYGEGYTYEGVIQYGTPNGTYLYSFPLNNNITDIPVIFNRITLPSKTLIKNIDFTISDGYIFFKENPFDSDLFALKELYDGDTMVDREIAVWAYFSDVDWQLLHSHFGYVLGIYLQSSQNYKELLIAIFDAIVKGTSCKEILMFLSAVTGIPFAQETETVELITKTIDCLSICTDKNCYRFPVSATAVVSVGDVLYYGDTLVDSFNIYDINNGQVPNDISSISVGVGLISNDFADGLMFKNEEVPLVVETVNNKTKVSFEIGGLPTDVELFWETVHNNGVAKGQTLANLLDLRDSPTTEPTAASLPATINPLEFLINYILKFNSIIIKLKLNKLQAVFSLNYVKLLRKILPPWTYIIILVEYSIDGEEIILDSGYVETTESGYGFDEIEETIDNNYIIEECAIRSVNGRCR